MGGSALASTCVFPFFECIHLCLTHVMRATHRGNAHLRTHVHGISGYTRRHTNSPPLDTNAALTRGGLPCEYQIHPDATPKDESDKSCSRKERYMCRKCTQSTEHAPARGNVTRSHSRVHHNILCFFGSGTLLRDILYGGVGVVHWRLEPYSVDVQRKRGCVRASQPEPASVWREE